ncbi:Kinesin light chain 3 [Irineochytrium annulatum]|nr:Kinesin light chain 3 [Irineochytrium annulatum]
MAGDAAAVPTTAKAGGCPEPAAMTATTAEAPGNRAGKASVASGARSRPSSAAALQKGMSKALPEKLPRLPKTSFLVEEIALSISTPTKPVRAPTSYEPDYMTTRGVTMQFLVAVRDALAQEGCLDSNPPTKDIGRHHLRDPYGASVIDFLSAAGAGGVVGDAAWYIIHEPTCSFRDLVEAVETFFLQNGNDAAKTVVWLDVMSVPESVWNVQRTLTFVRATLPTAMRKIGRSLVVFDESGVWNSAKLNTVCGIVMINQINNSLLTASQYCCWEVLQSNQVDMAMPSKYVQKFEECLQTSSPATSLGACMMYQPDETSRDKLSAELARQDLVHSIENLWRGLFSQIRRRIEASTDDELKCAQWSTGLGRLQSKALDALKGAAGGRVSLMRSETKSHSDMIALAKDRIRQPDAKFDYLINEALSVFTDAERRFTRALGDYHKDSVEALCSLVQFMPNDKLVAESVLRARHCGREVTELKLKLLSFAAEWFHASDDESGKGLGCEGVQGAVGIGLTYEKLLLECIDLAQDVYGHGLNTWSHQYTLAKCHVDKKRVAEAVEIIKDVKKQVWESVDAAPAWWTPREDYMPGEDIRTAGSRAFDFIRRISKLYERLDRYEDTINMLARAATSISKSSVDAELALLELAEAHSRMGHLGEAVKVCRNAQGGPMKPAWDSLEVRIEMEQLLRALPKKLCPTDVLPTWEDVGLPYNNSQHGTGNRPFEWWTTTFKNAIEKMKNVVMVMEPWDKPYTLTRAWCVFEIYSCVITKSAFHVAMCKESRDALMSALVTQPETILQSLTTKSVQECEAVKPDDLEQIIKAVTSGPGVEELDALVRGVLHTWFLDRVLAPYIKHMHAYMVARVLEGLYDIKPGSPRKVLQAAIELLASTNSIVVRYLSRHL